MRTPWALHVDPEDTDEPTPPADEPDCGSGRGCSGR